MLFFSRAGAWQSKSEKGIFMKKGVALLLLLLLLASGLTACCSVDDQVARALGVDVSNGEQLSYSDTHGGFHGDGTTCIVYHFDGDTALEEIKNSAAWQKFPLDETVRTLVYGSFGDDADIWPALSDDVGEPIVPEIQNGYYRLIDRQYDPTTSILDRYSYNFTLGLYDTDTNTLYFCMLDT